MKKNKKNWKKILSVALICLVSLIVFGVFAGSYIQDTTTIKNSAFRCGDLDENGKYIASEQSIYTKEAFGCKGLRVEPDFEAGLTYDVYYYDATGKLVESKKALTDIYDEDYPLAMTCRIVIHPEIPADVDAKEYKIGTFDVYKIAKNVKITVNKDQNYLYSNSINVYDATKVQDGYTFDSYEKGVSLNLVEAENVKVSNEIKIDSECTKYDIFVKCDEKSNLKIVAVALDAENVVLSNSSVSLNTVAEGDWCKLTIDLDEIKGDVKAETIVISMPVNADCYVFGYAN